LQECKIYFAKQVLHSRLCKTSFALLERAAILTLAAQTVVDRMPFAELVKILQPQNLAVKAQANRNAKTKATNPTSWQSVPRNNTVYTLLKTITQVRNRFHGHYEQLNTDAHAELSGGVLCLLNMVLHVFLPYRDLRVAMLSETEGKMSVHCFWEGDTFLCSNNQANFEDMRAVWQDYIAAEDRLNAPAPPRQSENWQWSGTLLLYDENAPYQRCVYLMPLGFSYQLQPLSTQRELLPGWLESVYWRQKRVASVTQRAYRGDLPKAREIPAVHAAIENIVKNLCEHFAFPFPEGEPEPLAPTRVFDLRHDQLAIQWTKNTVTRTNELTRLQHLLLDSAGQRLLLLGESGLGKTILLAQFFLAHQDTAVLVSMDDGQLTASGDTEESTGQRVGMHCLAGLHRLLGLSSPTMLLSIPEIQQAIAACLSKSGEQKFFIVLDAVNQAVDPGGLLSGLPNPLPAALFVLASSQDERRAVDSLTLYGQQKWERTPLSKLAADEAKAIVWQAWLSEIADQPTPSAADLPPALLAAVCEQGEGIPIFLHDWTLRLRKEWGANPEQFATLGLMVFEQERATALPEFLRLRWERAQAEFRPPVLLSLLLWCLTVVAKSLSVSQLQQGVKALQQLPFFAELPPLSRETVEEGLFKLAGFLGYTQQFAETQWELRHEVLGNWFMRQYGCVEWLPSIRVALVPVGALPLPASASDAEVTQWVEWVVTEDYEHYRKFIARSARKCDRGCFGARSVDQHDTIRNFIGALGGTIFIWNGDQFTWLYLSD
jgi:hypothetical protein